MTKESNNSSSNNEKKIEDLFSNKFERIKLLRICGGKDEKYPEFFKKINCLKKSKGKTFIKMKSFVLCLFEY